MEPNSDWGSNAWTPDNGQYISFPWDGHPNHLAITDSPKYMYRDEYVINDGKQQVWL